MNMKKRTSLCLAALLLLTLCACGGRDSEAGDAAGYQPPADNTATTEYETVQDVSYLAGSWEVMGNGYSSGFAGKIHADEQGRLVLEDVFFPQLKDDFPQFSGSFIEEIEGDWVMAEDGILSTTLYVDDTHRIGQTYALGNYTGNTFILGITSDGVGANCTYVRSPDPNNAVSGVDESDPQFSAVWETILDRLVGSWELINPEGIWDWYSSESAQYYPSSMEIFNNDSRDAFMLWEGEDHPNYWNHWYVFGRYFRLDASDSFGPIMYKIELDDNYLVMSRVPEDGGVETYAYYYKSAEPAQGEPAGPSTEPPTDSPTDTRPGGSGTALDYTPGRENTISAPRFRGQKITSDFDYCSVAYQDGKVYYVGDNGKTIYKRAFDAPTSEAEAIWFDTNGNSLLIEDIQVLEDWVYLTDSHHMYRISTTPGRYEEIMGHTDSQTVIRGNEIYYMVGRSVQVSAQHYDKYFDLVWYNLDTGKTVVAATLQLGTDSNQAVYIESYTSEAILLHLTGTRSNTKYYLFYFDSGMLVDVTEKFTIEDAIYRYVSDGTAFYQSKYNQRAGLYKSSTTAFYRLAPENGYEPEWIASNEGRTYITACTGGMIFSDTGDLSYIDLSDGETHTINGDDASKVYCPGDGYVYYQCHHAAAYRVRLDGTGWEQL